jgi:cytochrome c-type biogenesis protein
MEGMFSEHLLAQVAEAKPLAFVLVVLAGLTMGVAPSSLPLFSVVAGWMAGRGPTEGAPRTEIFGALMLTAGFVLGIASVDAIIGALFAMLGFGVIRAFAANAAIMNFLVAGLLLVIGLALLRFIRIRFPVLRPSAKPAQSFLGAYLLGIPFGLSTCPACTPMVLPILGAAAVTGNPLLGAALLFVFGLARGIPLVLAGTAVGGLTHVRRISPWVPKIERAGGRLGAHRRIVLSLPGPGRLRARAAGPVLS